MLNFQIKVNTIIVFTNVIQISLIQLADVLRDAQVYYKFI